MFRVKLYEQLTGIKTAFLNSYGILLRFEKLEYYETPVDKVKTRFFGGVNNENINEAIMYDKNTGITYLFDDEQLDNTFDKDVGLTSNVCNVLWTGHVVETSNDVYNISHYTRYNVNKPTAGTIHIFARMIDANTINPDLESEMKVYVHELSHYLGAPDHYHNEINKECKNKQICSEIGCGINPRPSECSMNVERNIYKLIAGDEHTYRVRHCNACKIDVQIFINSKF